jgi:hypothetical protein
MKDKRKNLREQLDTSCYKQLLPKRSYTVHTAIRWQ